VADRPADDRLRRGHLGRRCTLAPAQGGRRPGARYAFLLSVPVVGGAALYKALELTQTGLPSGTVAPFLAGMAAAAVSGFAAIWFTVAYLRRHTFKLFAIYRFVVGGGILLIILVGFRHAGGI
jgi:undecaprenyl-diphosphatase